MKIFIMLPVPKCVFAFDEHFQIYSHDLAQPLLKFIRILSSSNHYIYSNGRRTELIFDQVSSNRDWAVGIFAVARPGELSIALRDGLFRETNNNGRVCV